MLGPRVRDVRGHQEVEGQRQGSADRKDGLARDRRVAGDTHEIQLLSILVNAEVKFAVFHFLRDMIIDAPLGEREKAQRLPGFKHTTARDFALEVFPLFIIAQLFTKSIATGLLTFNGVLRCLVD